MTGHHTCAWANCNPCADLSSEVTDLRAEVDHLRAALECSRELHARLLAHLRQPLSTENEG